MNAVWMIAIMVAMAAVYNLNKILNYLQDDWRICIK